MTIFVGNVAWTVDNDRLSQEFAECGEVVSARVQLDRNTGRSRGFGYVTFATSEAVEAAIALQGTKEIDGRTLNIDKSNDTGGNKAANRDNRAQAFGDTRSAPSNVLFVGNLSWDTTEDALWEVFQEHGAVDSVRVPTDRESGKPKGYGYIEFSNAESAKKAIDALNGQEIGGRTVRLDFSTPRDGGGGHRGGRGGRGGGFGGGRGGFGDRDGGRVRRFLSCLSTLSHRTQTPGRPWRRSWSWSWW
jgi:nucleolin